MSEAALALETLPAADVQDQGRVSVIPRAELKALSRIRPWRAMAHMAFEYAGIAAAISVSEIYWNPFLYIAAVIWIAGRQHGIGVLGHDAVHSTLFKKAWQNDLAGEILHSSLLLDYQQTRAHHLAHHRYQGTQHDPDSLINGLPVNMVPVKRARLIWTLLRPLTGMLIAAVPLLIIKQLVDTLKGTFNRYSWIRLGFSLGFIAGCLASTEFLTMFFLYWLIPAATWTLFTVRLRSFAEHHGLNNDNPLAQSRTVYTSIFGRLLLTPNNINYHNAHHLFTSVPFYNLPSLDKKLLENARYKEAAPYTQGYGRFVKDFVQKWSA